VFALGAGAMLTYKLYSEGDVAQIGMIFLMMSWVVPMWLRGDLD